MEIIIDERQREKRMNNRTGAIVLCSLLTGAAIYSVIAHINLEIIASLIIIGLFLTGYLLYRFIKYKKWRRWTSR